MTFKITLISSGQPSLNPRLVKEADALAEAGYKVKVIYQYWNSWGTQLDKELIAGKRWEGICIGGSPEHKKVQHWISRLRYKLGNILAKYLGFRFNIGELAIGRCTLDLLSAARKDPADLYIAHNLAALPAAVKAAKKNRARCGFDAEDFHRNEISNNPLDFDVQLKTYIENKYIPQVNYFSAASSFISKAYKKLYPTLNPQTFLNAFPKQNIERKKYIDNSPLKLFWFSQTIGKGRGLENIIKTIGNLREFPIQLHLLGNYNSDIQGQFNHLAKTSGIREPAIFYYLPLPPDKIFNFASQFDVGLATEAKTPKNRDICLTNKIFTYIQSGLAIISSNTTAQQAFMQQYPGMGKVYRQNDLFSLETIIREYLENETLLNKHQKQAAVYARGTLNWETEKEKFLALVKKTLNSR